MYDEEIVFHPIGYIHSEFKDVEHTPKSTRNSNKAWMEINPKYLEAMSDIKVGEEYMVLFYFNKSEGYDLKVPIFGDGPITGLFATHAPRRPNPIGVSNVIVEEVEDNIIRFRGVDMLDGTPILDIKDVYKLD